MKIIFSFVPAIELCGSVMRLEPALNLNPIFEMSLTFSVISILVAIETLERVASIKNLTEGMIR